MAIFESIGTLHYDYDKSGYKLICLIQPDIVNYYYSLIPKYINLKRQAFAPHVSIVRKESQINMNLWGKYENHSVSFFYENIINHNEIYWWLDVYSKNFEQIKQELGLSIKKLSGLNNFNERFHITLGNTK